jgi:hypothetical protein
MNQSKEHTDRVCIRSEAFGVSAAKCGCLKCTESLSTPAAPEHSIDRTLEQECRDVIAGIVTPYSFGSVNFTEYDLRISKEMAAFIRTREEKHAASLVKARLDEAEWWRPKVGLVTAPMFSACLDERMEKLRAALRLTALGRSAK